MQKPALVIMAAGMGSRFGGLKQITPVDERGHLIIDYSIFDAVRAGFEQVICIIKPENEAAFRAAIGDRIAKNVQLDYACQTAEQLPQGFSVPEGRTKPWGTAHAVLCAKEKIHGPFAVINADDFYGRGAFEAVYRFLAEARAAGEYAMVGYRIENTLTENVDVARGVCEVDGEGFLRHIVERTRIEPRPGGAAYTEDGANFTFLPAGTFVSLNLWGFQHSMLGQIERRFAPFLRENLPRNPLKCEYFLPYVADAALRAGEATIRVLPTGEKWYGVTYKEDLQTMREAMARLCQEGVYPEKLWAQ